MHLTKRFYYYLRPTKDQLKKLNEILTDLQFVHCFTIEYARKLFIANGTKTIPSIKQVFLKLIAEHEYLFWIGSYIIEETVKSTINSLNSFTGEAHELDYLIKTAGQFNTFTVPAPAIWRIKIYDKYVELVGVGEMYAKIKQPITGKLRRATFVRQNETTFKLYLLVNKQVSY